MKTRSIIVLLAAAGMFGALAFAQPSTGTKAPQPSKPAAPAKPEQPAQPPAMSEEDMKKFEEWMVMAATPNEHHQRFKDFFAGTWDAKVTMFGMGPEPIVSTGTMVNTLIHGGKYIHHDFSGVFMGEAFTGSGHWAYNNTTKKYEGTWLDSMGTTIMYMTGSYDDASRTYTMTGAFDGPGGMKITQRDTIHIVDANKHTMEMFHTMPGQPEMKVMEIVYTRKAGAPAAPAGS